MCLASENTSIRRGMFPCIGSSNLSFGMNVVLHKNKWLCGLYYGFVVNISEIFIEVRKIYVISLWRTLQIKSYLGYLRFRQEIIKQLRYFVANRVFRLGSRDFDCRLVGFLSSSLFSFGISPLWASRQGCCFLTESLIFSNAYFQEKKPTIPGIRDIWPYLTACFSSLMMPSAAFSGHSFRPGFPILNQA